jgi:hypothetical protein
MCDDRDALLASIAASPDDDAPGWRSPTGTKSTATTTWPN